MDASSHDLVVYNGKLEEIHRLKGTPLFESWLPNMRHYARRSSSDHTSEEDLVLWMDGNYTFSYVDSNELVPIKVDKFWENDTGSPSFGCVIVPSNDMHKIAGIGICSSSQYIHILDGSTNPGQFKSKESNTLLKSRLSI